MTREEIKNTPELVDFMLDKCVLADSRTKVRKRLEEVCDLAIQALSQEPCDEQLYKNGFADGYEQGHKDAEQKSGKCKNCKYFEYDSVAKVDGIPLIVAHEICNKWGGGCKTSENGYCYLFEPQESEDKTDAT